MNKISNLFSFIRPSKQIIPQYDRLLIKTTIEKDTWNNVQNGQITKDFYYSSEHIGYIRYRRETGQIGIFVIFDDCYRNVGLGKQILNNAIEDLRNNNQSSVWAVTTKNHPFWANVYNNKFIYKERVHYSVTGSGYLMNI